jgi:hypothetical protein
MKASPYFLNSKNKNMKKFIGIIILLLSVSLLSAQSTVPRFGVNPLHQGNTGFSLTYAYVAQTDVAGYDSVKVAPNAYETIYNLTISTDSLRFGSPNCTASHLGDVMRVIVQGTATGKTLTFKSPYIIGQGTLTTTTKMKAVISFIFDGAKWVETGRLAQ